MCFITSGVADDIVPKSVASSYHQFIMNNNIKSLEKILIEIHFILKVTKSSMVKPCRDISITLIMTIREGGIKIKKNSYPKGKGKGKVVRSKSIPIKKVDSDIAPTSNPNEAISFYFQHKGHWKCSCRKSMEDVNKNKSNKFGTLSNFMIKFHSTSTFSSCILNIGCGTHISMTCSD